MFKSYAKLFLNLFFIAIAALVLSACRGESVPVGAGDDDPTEIVRDQPKMLYYLSGVQGQAGLGGNGGPALQAQHYWPQDILTIGDDIFVTDWNNHCVHKITPDGVMERYIGSGLLGDDTEGPKELIDLNHPSNITLGPDGKLYMSAWHNWKVKVIDMNTGLVSSPIGTGIGYGGDGGPASEAKFNLPASLVFDAAGDIILADQANQCIRKVNFENGEFTTVENVAGLGMTKGFVDGIGDDVRFSNPVGSDATPGMRLSISADKQFVYIADKDNHAIRKLNLNTREVTTICGNGAAGYTGDGGLAVNAQLNQPIDVHCTTDGTLYIADEWNHVVRRILPNGIIETVAGNGVSGAAEDGEVALDAKLNRPGGVFFDEATNILYIADTFNHQTKFVINP